MLNTLGCGDITRGGFLGSITKKIAEHQRYDVNKVLNDSDIILDAARFAVAAGTARTGTFNLNEALKEKLQWKDIERQAKQKVKVDEISAQTLVAFRESVRRIYLNFLYVQSTDGHRCLIAGRRKAEHAAQIHEKRVLAMTNPAKKQISRAMNALENGRGDGDAAPVASDAQLLNFEYQNFGSKYAFLVAAKKLGCDFTPPAG